MLARSSAMPALASNGRQKTMGGFFCYGRASEIIMEMILEIEE
jgi:hypothetical protein